MDDSLDLTEKTAFAFDLEPPSQPIVRVAMPASRRPPVPMRTARGTQTGLLALPRAVPDGPKRPSAVPPIPLAARRPRAVSAPPAIAIPRPVEVARDSRVLPPLPTPSPAWLRSTHAVSTQPGSGADSAPADLTGSWFARADEDNASTHYFERPDAPTSRRDLALVGGIAVGVLVIGLLVGLGLRGDSTARTTQPTTVAPVVAPARAVPPPAVAAAPVAVARAPEASPGVPRTKVVTLPITSVPRGATVALLVDDESTVVGQTPLTVSIDPSRHHKIVAVLRGYRTKIQDLDPSGATLQMVRANRAGVAPSARTVRPSATAGGVLRVSSTPACEIVIDGKPTGLVTPQRAIRLAAGTHSIVLTNARLKIRRSLTVVIKPQRVTRLIENLTGR